MWELWILFDDKLRPIKGVEIDLDLSDVKPIRAHPYKWSPAKVQAGREVVKEFLDDGIVTTSGQSRLSGARPHSSCPSRRAAGDSSWTFAN